LSESAVGSDTMMDRQRGLQTSGVGVVLELRLSNLVRRAVV